MKEWLKDNKGFIILAILAGVIGAIVGGGLLKSYQVSSTSMLPTLHTDDRLVVTIFDSTEYTRGDIVVFQAPDSWGVSVTLIKRVIAVGGDTLECCTAEGELLLNGEKLIEPYVAEGADNTYQGESWRYEVPEEHFVVLGDNRSYSADSRYYAEHFIPNSNVLAVPKFRYWPLNRVGFVE